MKTKFTILSMALLLCVPMMAQRIVEANEEFANYDRNSLSVITIRCNDGYDRKFVPLVESFDFGEKFDMNEINTKYFDYRGGRGTQYNPNVSRIDGTTWEPENEVSISLPLFANLFRAMGNKPSVDPQTVNATAQFLNNNNVGKEILNYLLRPDANGVFSRELIDERGRWNADDKDYQAAQLTQVNTLGQNGEGLIANSYIIVFDMKNPTKVEKKSKNSEGKEIITVSWKANVAAYVFGFDNAKEMVNNVVNNMWIYENDTPEVKAAKRQAYRDLRVNMRLVAAVAVAESSQYLDVALLTTYKDLMYELEKAVPEWQVTIDCESVQPKITAKTGRKEGVRNGQRYAIYGQVYNQSKDRREYKRKGYARATKICNNVKVVDGSNDVTYFYRISGTKKLVGSEVLKQKNDLGVSIYGAYNLNGSSSAPQSSRAFSSFSMVDAGIDYLLYIHKNGLSHYGTFYFGYDQITGANLQKGHEELGKFEDFNIDDKFFLSQGASYMNFSLAYMMGIKIKQFCELQPFISVGMDLVSIKGHKLNYEQMNNLAALEEYEMTTEFTEKTAKSTSSYMLEPGVRLTFNVIYPIQFYVQAKYSMLLNPDNAYNVINNYIKDCGYGHDKGLGVGGGIRICL